MSIKKLIRSKIFYKMELPDVIEDDMISIIACKRKNDERVGVIQIYENSDGWQITTFRLSSHENLGKSIGYKLLSEAIKILKSKDVQTVFVIPKPESMDDGYIMKDEELIKAYKRMGFKKSSLAKDGSNRHIYVLDF